MDNWHVVVAASRGYEPGLRAFLNSFEAYHSTARIQVHALMLEMHEMPLPQWCNRVQLQWENNPKSGRNTAWSTKIPRFKYAAELQGVVMLCDADMFFCANVSTSSVLPKQD